MPKITYTPLFNGDPIETEWDGVLFTAGQPVDFDGRTAQGKKFVERAKANRWFSVDGEPKAEIPKKPLATAEEYRAYAIEWMNQAKSSSAMQKRWDDEKPLRDECGWGGDDDALLEPFFAPRLEILKRAEG